MQLDALENLSLLSDYQFKNMLLPFARKANTSHVIHLLRIRHEIKKGVDLITLLQNLSSSLKLFVTSGKLYEYLNAGCHGNRSSYISLSSPWQHLEEWTPVPSSTIQIDLGNANVYRLCGISYNFRTIIS